jgi:RNA polymerase sigma-70 factor (ECF subfamily)
VQAPATDELAELVSRAKAGDRQAFEDLVSATYAEAFTLATRLMGNEEDASDVVQDAYLRAFKAIGRFRGDARFTTWLYRIVANCASTSLGRRGRHRHEELDDSIGLIDDHPDRDPERKASDSYDRQRVQAALSGLPEKLRVVVVLRDVYDLPHEAIAAELGITETAAKVRLHRARKKLRARLFPVREEVAGVEGADDEEAVVRDAL